MLDPIKGIGLFTDGSSWSQDKSGGWAYIAVDAFDNEISDCGRVENTTNNRMEMEAWIRGLNAIFDEYGACEVIVFSDSQYVGYGAMQRERNRVANRDLWDELDEAVDRHLYIEFQHIKGHNGNSYNERVDKLASEVRRNGS
jgi:ribonuclease HI